MQYTLLGLLVLLAAQSVLSESNQEIKEACNKETGFDGDIEKLNFVDPAMPKQAKCALACGLDKKGVFKADGSIDTEKLKALSEDLVKDEDLRKKYIKATGECDTAAKANKCDTAFEYMKCLATKAQNM